MTVTQPPPYTEAVNENDTDADTCCLGKNFIIYKYTTRTADVYAYDKSYKPITNVPIVTGATAYDNPTTGETYILLFNESLYYGTRMDHSLFNPNQIRKYGVPVWDNPFDKERPFSIEVNDELQIPLITSGTKVYFKSRTPSKIELESCKKIEMTSNKPWNPSCVQLQEVNVHHINQDPVIKQVTLGMNDQYLYCEDISTNDIMLNEISSSLTSLNNIERNLYDQEMEDIPRARTYVSNEQHNKITADRLSDIFCIGLERAKQTLQLTRQQGTRSAILPIGQRVEFDCGEVPQ